MPEKKLVLLRQKAFIKQACRCYYCAFPIWEKDPEYFRSFYRLTAGQAAGLRSTAEHLLAQCEDGKDVEDNIVAACLFCNQTRHKAKRPLEPERYRARVQSKVSRGGWQQQELHHVLHMIQ